MVADRQSHGVAPLVDASTIGSWAHTLAIASHIHMTVLPVPPEGTTRPPASRNPLAVRRPRGDVGSTHREEAMDQESSLKQLLRDRIVAQLERVGKAQAENAVLSLDYELDQLVKLASTVQSVIALGGLTDPAAKR
jgi:hypothetical protein